MNIASECMVGIEYVLTLDSGEEIDRSPEEQPLEFIVDAGEIIPGLETALMGKKAGDSLQVRIEPGNAYGDYDKELMQIIPKQEFPDDIKLEQGLVLAAEGPHGAMEFVITEIRDSEVVADFNHPLAGQHLNFDVNIKSVRQATNEELAEAHNAHDCEGCGGDCH